MPLSAGSERPSVWIHRLTASAARAPMRDEANGRWLPETAVDKAAHGQFGRHTAAFGASHAIRQRSQQPDS